MQLGTIKSLPASHLEDLAHANTTPLSQPNFLALGRTGILHMRYQPGIQRYVAFTKAKALYSLAETIRFHTALL